MRELLLKIKGILASPVRLVRRIRLATRYYNYRYRQIWKWALSSNEDTNFTYPLSDSNLEYLAHIISVVTGQTHQTIMDYFNEAQHDEYLANAIVKAIGASEFASRADKTIHFGRRLGWYAFVRILKPVTVIETGVDKGLGSILLCAAILRNQEEGAQGEYYGTDINPKAGFILSDKYKTVGKILYGDSIESLKKLDCQIDLFINDSDHSFDYEMKEYQTIQSKLGKNAIVLGDNSHWSNKLSEFSLLTNRRFLFFQEQPSDHWYPGAGIGISY